MVDFQPVEMARQNAETKATAANQFAARGNTVADELRKAIGERYGESPVAKEASTARATYLSAAPQARSEVAGLISGGAILSPTQQQALMASKQGAAIAPVMGANVIENAAFGTLQDLIGAGVNAYNAQSQGAQGLAQIAQQSYGNLLSELVQKAQMEYQQAQLDMARQNANKKDTQIVEVDGQLWLVDTQTGEKITPLGKAYHAGGGATSDEKNKAILDKMKSDAKYLDYNQLYNKYVGEVDAGLIDATYLSAKGKATSNPEDMPKLIQEQVTAGQPTIKYPLSSSLVNMWDNARSALLNKTGLSNWIR